MSGGCKDEEENRLSGIEYLRYLRDSYPQTRYALRQWDALYEAYACELCDESLKRSYAVASLVNLRAHDLSRASLNGRYTACVNVPFDDDINGVVQTSPSEKKLLHVCNFLPLIIGTRLDARVRYTGRTDRVIECDLEHFGHAFMFGSFWVFNSFISTDSRQCHRYREHTNSTRSMVRMYVYDETGKGNMLYVGPNGTMRLRDKYRREVELFNSSGEYTLIPDEAKPLTTVVTLRGAVVKVTPASTKKKRRSTADGQGTTTSATSTTTTNDSSFSANDVVDEFQRDALSSPFDRIGPREFFRLCRAYMVYGIGVNDSSVESIRDIDHLNNKRISNAPALYTALMIEFARTIRFVVMGRVGGVTNDVTGAIDESAVTSTVAVARVRATVAQYGAMSHRANMLPFISRKTHIRHDWCESMKRQMKNEIRSNRIMCAAQFQSNGSGGTATTTTTAISSGPANITCVDNVTSSTISSSSAASVASTTDQRLLDDVLNERYRAPDVAQDNAKVVQQFYCAKLHSDVEYDYELIKRMRVVNLNAMTCLKMPLGFDRFLSYFNVGNIGNAGRVMNRTHCMRESYVCDVVNAVRRTVAWIRSLVPSNCLDDDTISAANGGIDDVTGTIFAINEIPIAHTRANTCIAIDAITRTIHGSGEENSENKFHLWPFLLALKYREPGAVVTLTSLSISTDQPTAHYVNVRLVNGVPMCPVIVVSNNGATNTGTATTVVAAAEFCHRCEDYRPTQALTVSFDDEIHRAIDRMLPESGRDSDRAHATVLPRCRRHAWFTRHELTLYGQSIGAVTAAVTAAVDNDECTDSVEFPPRPMLHEIACHGILSVAAYPYVTEASKLIVAINAHRRALDIVAPREEIDGFFHSSLLDHFLAAATARSWSHLERNGKFTRLRAPLSAIADAATISSTQGRLVPRNALRLLFAFGDVDMFNCEDGYVLNERLALSADTVFSKKISFVCKTRVFLTTVMTLEYLAELGGVRLYVGTFRSTSPMRFNAVSGICVNERTSQRRQRARDCDGGGNVHSVDIEYPRYVYDMYVTWSASYLIVSSVGRTKTIVSAISTNSQTYDATTANYGNDIGIGCGQYYDRKILRETRSYDRSESPIAESSMDLYTRFVRVTLRAVDIRQTFKLQNSFGQKGIAHYADLSDFVTDRGEQVDVVSSMYSLIGRFACGQLLEQRENDGLRRIYSRSSKCYVGVGGYGYFFVSDDSSHNNFIYSVKHGGENPMRVCKLTYDSLLENGASSGAFVKASDFESGATNPYAGMSRTVVNALDCYGVYGRGVRLHSQRLLSLRRRVYDVALLDTLHDDDDTSSPAVGTTRPRKRKRSSASS